MARELIKLKASKPIFHANSNALYDFRHFAAFSADPIHPKKPSGWPKALIGSPCHGVIELLAATKNEGKLKEIEKLFTGGSIGVKLYFLPDFNITVDCPETEETFIENATQKSLFYGKLVPDIYTVGDDSGLAVEGLNGAPGIYSSRYSGPGATDEKNIIKLLEQLKNINNRKAKFVTAVCLSKNGQVIQTFTGEVEGIIIDEKRGSGGFGYDPVFYYPPFKRTFAELSTEEKNRISHRARAFQKLKNFLESLG